MELIAILLTIHAASYLLAAFFKKPINTLQCGIYGFSGKARLNKQDLRLALAKFKILGLYNETRGKDSCGVLVNNVVTKGVGPKKLFQDFIEDTIFTINPKNRIFLGHNRSASSGWSTDAKNQHPFIVNNDLHLTHNGTLKETLEFCNKYELPYGKIDVDSEMLAMALYKSGDEVLCNYKGAAALAYTFMSKPNTLYLYHGASKQFKTGKEVEERPLFYMTTKEGIYYSSLPEALSALRENDDEEPYMLPHNLICEIVDGEFTENEVAIERGEINIESPKSYGRAGYTNYSGGYNDDHHNYGRWMQPALPNANHTAHRAAAVEKQGSLDVLSIRKETLPKRVIEDVYSNYLYFYRSRYHTHYTDKPGGLAQGPYFVSPKKGYINDQEDTTTKTLYFYNGVLLKSESAYKEVMDKKNNTYNDLEDELADWAFVLSKYAEQPVYPLPGEGRAVYRWWKDGKPFGGVYEPLFSGRSYTIKEGYLNDIKSSHKEEVCYHVDLELAEAERKLYLSGGLLKPPVKTQNPFDRDYLKSLPPAYVNKVNTAFTSGDNTPFYLRKFRTTKEAYDTFGPMECMAIDAYLRWYLENGVAWTIVDEDVFLFRTSMVEELITESKTLVEWINNEDDVNYLKKEYKNLIIKQQQVIDGMNSKKTVDLPGASVELQTGEGHIYYPEINDDIDDESIEDGVFHEEEQEDEVVELIEDILDSFTQLHDNATDLQMIDMGAAQSMAHHLYATIDNFRSKCENDKDLVKQPDFREFVKNIKELKNGVI